MQGSQALCCNGQKNKQSKDHWRLGGDVLFGSWHAFDVASPGSVETPATVQDKKNFWRDAKNSFVSAVKDGLQAFWGSSCRLRKDQQEDRQSELKAGLHTEFSLNKIWMLNSDLFVSFKMLFKLLGVTINDSFCWQNLVDEKLVWGSDDRGGTAVERCYFFGEKNVKKTFSLAFFKKILFQNISWYTDIFASCPSMPLITVPVLFVSAVGGKAEQADVISASVKKFSNS